MKRNFKNETSIESPKESKTKHRKPSIESHGRTFQVQEHHPFRKGAQDKKRARRFAKLSREISVAVKTGGNDAASNPRLRTAMHRRAAPPSENMPNDNIAHAPSPRLREKRRSEAQYVVCRFAPEALTARFTVRGAYSTHVIDEALTEGDRARLSRARQARARIVA